MWIFLSFRRHAFPRRRTPSMERQLFMVQAFHPFSCNNLLNQISGWGSTEAIEIPVEQRKFVPGSIIEENIDEGKLREVEVRDGRYEAA